MTDLLRVSLLREDILRDYARAMLSDLDGLRARWFAVVKDALRPHAESSGAMNIAFDEKLRVPVAAGVLDSLFPFRELTGDTAEMTLMWWQHNVLMGQALRRSYVRDSELDVLTSAFVTQANDRWTGAFMVMVSGEPVTIPAIAGMLAQFVLNQSNLTQATRTAATDLAQRLLPFLGELIHMKTSLAFGDVAAATAIAAKYDPARRW